MTFEEWWTQRETVAGCALDGADNASAAWGYQQERIDHLESIIKANQIRPKGKSMLAYLPEGYVLVPKEPTEKMIEAGYNAYVNSGWIRTYEIYEAMIQAAQEEE